MSLAEAKDYLAEGQFPAGSMGPKVTALMEYVSASDGGIGVITTPQNMANAIKGTAGTRMVK
jgi:carbamate kinase